MHSVAGSIALNKKQGVSGQSVQPAANTPVYTVEKDFHSKTLIKEAILENDFLKNLSLTQVRCAILRQFLLRIRIFGKIYRLRALEAARVHKGVALIFVLQVSELVEAMHEKKIPKGCYVIREGESGSYLYVAAEGEFEVRKLPQYFSRSSRCELVLLLLSYLFRW